MNNLPFIKSCCDYQKVVLPNGLTVLVYEMPQHTGVHAVYATKFGSTDREYELNGKRVILPAGIAHFLEHKMFENENEDAFELYAKTGAVANAFTSFDKTCYVFTASENIDESLDILLSFVSKPYFTKKTVEKEQGIIGQEIDMYLDSAEWRLLFGLFESLYSKHYLRDDIAGSAKSISQITPELLYECTNAFYRPDNMVISVAGNITLKRVLDACERADIKPKEGQIKRIYPAEPRQVNRPFTQFTMDISRPILGVAFKEIPFEKPSPKSEIVCELLTELIAGGMTPLYRRLYDEGLVSPGFGGEFIPLKGALTIAFTAETTSPELVRGLILDEIKRVRQHGVDEELFTLCKNSMYGDLISDLESPDDLATGMMSTFFKGRTLYDEIQALATVTKNDVDTALKALCLEENSATLIIRPSQGDME